jgi:UDP-glucose 4-epimerase
LRFFITGGAGFIGSHCVSHLVSRGDHVKVFDNLTSGTLRHVEQWLEHPNFSFVKGDLQDLELLVSSMAESEVVIHLAANPDIAKAVSEPDIDFRQGTVLTQNVLESMRLNEVAKLLYTSGSGVYGEVPDLEFKESFGPCIPISTYGASKLACEALISAYSHMFGINGRVFRFANVVGGGQTHGVGYDFLRRLHASPGELKILGDGSQTKSYIHISDVLKAMMLGLQEIDKIAFDLYNVSTQDALSVKEIAELSCEVLGLDPIDVKFLFSGGDRGWLGDVPLIRLDSSKIRARGWENKYGSRQAMRLALEEMLPEVVGFGESE